MADYDCDGCDKEKCEFRYDQTSNLKMLSE